MATGGRGKPFGAPPAESGDRATTIRPNAKAAQRWWGLGLPVSFRTGSVEMRQHEKKAGFNCGAMGTTHAGRATSPPHLMGVYSLRFSKRITNSISMDATGSPLKKQALLWE